MLGLIDLSGIGIVALGAVIALIIFNIPFLLAIVRHPVIAFIVGIIIAYILDDFYTNMQFADWIAIFSLIIMLIFTAIPYIKDYLKTKREKIEKIEKHMIYLDHKLAKIQGTLDAILHIDQKNTSRKKK